MDRDMVRAALWRFTHRKRDWRRITAWTLVVCMAIITAGSFWQEQQPETGGLTVVTYQETPTVLMPAAGWYYVAYCYSAGSWRGYRNGTEIFSQNKTFGLFGGSSAFGSAAASSNYWSGQLAEIRISSSARTAAEILMNAKLMGFLAS